MFSFLRNYCNVATDSVDVLCCRFCPDFRNKNLLQKLITLAFNGCNTTPKIPVLWLMPGIIQPLLFDHKTDSKKNNFVSEQRDLDNS